MYTCISQVQSNWSEVSHGWHGMGYLVVDKEEMQLSRSRRL
jgi:hypothetical protein